MGKCGGWKGRGCKATPVLGREMIAAKAAAGGACHMLLHCTCCHRRTPLPPPASTRHPATHLRVGKIDALGLALLGPAALGPLCALQRREQQASGRLGPLPLCGGTSGKPPRRDPRGAPLMFRCCPPSAVTAFCYPSQPSEAAASFGFHPRSMSKAVPAFKPRPCHPPASDPARGAGGPPGRGRPPPWQGRR